MSASLDRMGGGGEGTPKAALPSGNAQCKVPSKERLFSRLPFFPLTFLPRSRLHEKEYLPMGIKCYRLQKHDFTRRGAFT